MVGSPVLVRSLYAYEWALCVGLSSDGAFLGMGGDEGVIRVWHVDDGSVQWRNGGDESEIVSVAFSHNDRLVVETRDGDGEIVLHDTSSGEGILLDGEDPIPAVNSAVFSPDDTLVASCGADRTAKLWQLSDNSLLRTLIGHSNSVNSVNFSPDGTILATGSDDGTARLWNVASGQY